jgi:hypothetical protein
MLKEFAGRDYFRVHEAYREMHAFGPVNGLERL